MRRLRDLLSQCDALPAFNFYTMGQLEGILAAVREVRRPTLVQVSKRAWGSIDHDVIEWVVRERIPAASEGFAYAHLDHGWTIEAVSAALDMGFPSIMFDGSHLDIGQNIAGSSVAARQAREHGAAFEAEVGVVGRPGVPSTRTSVPEAVELAGAVEPDFLAVSIGTGHGTVPAELDFDLADEVHRRTGCRLALHGGSGVEPRDLARALRAGFVKFNFATGVDRTERAAYHRLAEAGDLPRSGDIQAAVVEDVKQYCIGKYRELGLC